MLKIYTCLPNTRGCSFSQELSEEIEDYTQRFNTEDQLEWNLVLQEVAAFVEVSFMDEKYSLMGKNGGS